MLKIKKVKPLLNHVITTANIYSNNIDTLSVDGQEGGEFKEYQTVVAVGPNVTNVKVGDLVVISGNAYARPVHKQKEDSITGLMTNDSVSYEVRFPILDINGVPHLFLYDRDLEFIVEDYEETDDAITTEEPEII